MTTDRAPLPQLAGGLFLTDGGLETTLIYLDGIELPHFAAFTLLDSEPGRAQLARYYQPYLQLCAETPGAGFVLETPTWRANPDWGRRLGLDAAALHALNREAARWVGALRAQWSPRLSKAIVLSGVIGPRGDGYVAQQADSAEQAADYHQAQMRALAEGGIEMLSALTMTHVAEALGVTLAAQRVGLPVAISFTVETDGCLPSGEGLAEAIRHIDAAAPAAGAAPPAYYAINCAHPSHFESVLQQGGDADWLMRIRALRANASVKSHAELDVATELDIGDPVDLGGRYLGLRERLRGLNVLGGCCGTDARHLRAIRDAWLDPGRARH